MKIYINCGKNYAEKYKESFSTWRDELEMVICLAAVICLMFIMLFFSGYFLELTLDLCKICREILKSVELVDKWILSVFVVSFFSPKILAGAEEFGTLLSFVKKSV